MRRSAWICRACGKTAFPSERGALRFLAKVRQINPDGHRPVRAYECPYGNGWHVTSQNERKTA